MKEKTQERIKPNTIITKKHLKQGAFLMNRIIDYLANANNRATSVQLITLKKASI